MTTIRSLTRLLAPVAGEAFASYIDRLAALNKVNRAVMLSYVGILEDENYHYINGFGVAFNKAKLERFTIATQLPMRTIEAMLLNYYKNVALDLPNIDFGIPGSFRLLPVTEWAYFSSSHACPHCLRENHGAWQLSWRLPWTFVCVRHECYLISHCPVCGLRLSHGGPKLAAPSRSWSNCIPVVGHCNNLHHEGMLGKIKRCSCDLTILSTRHASASTLEVQRLLNKHLGGQTAAILGEQVPPLMYFRDLRALCQLILFCAQPDVFSSFSLPEVSAFEKFAYDRERLSVAKSEYGRRCICPESPELMAAITRLATSILATNTATVGASLQPLIDQFIIKSKRRWSALKSYRFSDQLTSVFTRHMEATGSFDHAVGRKTTTIRAAPILYGTEHVPPLFWEDKFDRSFAAFFPRTNRTLARRFCSMALVKLCGEHSWAQSARVLGIANQSGSTEKRALKALRQASSLQEFGRALHEVAQQLSASPDKIDYYSRRLTLSNLTEIPFSEWRAMCHAAGITTGHVGVKNMYAAIWLWSALTGIEWRLAPGVMNKKKLAAPHKVGLTERQDKRYRRLSKTDFPKVAPLLLAYGALLLLQG